MAFSSNSQSVTYLLRKLCDQRQLPNHDVWGQLGGAALDKARDCFNIFLHTFNVLDRQSLWQQVEAAIRAQVSPVPTNTRCPAKMVEATRHCYTDWDDEFRLSKAFSDYVECCVYLRLGQNLNPQHHSQESIEKWVNKLLETVSYYLLFYEDNSCVRKHSLGSPEQKDCPYEHIHNALRKEPNTFCTVDKLLGYIKTAVDNSYKPKQTGKKKSNNSKKQKTSGQIQNEPEGSEGKSDSRSKQRTPVSLDPILEKVSLEKSEDPDALERRAVAFAVFHILWHIYCEVGITFWGTGQPSGNVIATHNSSLTLRNTHVWYFRFLGRVCHVKKAWKGVSKTGQQKYPWLFPEALLKNDGFFEKNAVRKFKDCVHQAFKKHESPNIKSRYENNTDIECYLEELHNKNAKRGIYGEILLDIGEYVRKERILKGFCDFDAGIDPKRHPEFRADGSPPSREEVVSWAKASVEEEMSTLSGGSPQRGRSRRGPFPFQRLFTLRKNERHSGGGCPKSQEAANLYHFCRLKGKVLSAGRLNRPRRVGIHG